MSVLWIIGSRKNGPRACSEGPTRKRPASSRWRGITGPAGARPCVPDHAGWWPGARGLRKKCHRAESFSTAAAMCGSFAGVFTIRNSHAPGRSSQTSDHLTPEEFYGSAEITPAPAKVRLVQIAEEIIALPGSDPIASVKNLGASPEAFGGTGSVRAVAIDGRHGGRPSSSKAEASLGVSDPTGMKVPVEIEAEFPSGVSDQVKRAVSENANVLNFKRKTWE